MIFEVPSNPTHSVILWFYLKTEVEQLTSELVYAADAVTSVLELTPKISALLQEPSQAWEQKRICVVEREVSTSGGKQYTFVVLQSAVQTSY